MEILLAETTTMIYGIQVVYTAHVDLLYASTHAYVVLFHHRHIIVCYVALILSTLQVTAYFVALTM
jgi:hypothetical protein